MIHGDYSARVRDGGFDSVTQYELWKAIWSGLNDGNFHELDWALVRHNEFLDTFVPMTFIGNHDVTRIASRLDNTKHVEHAVVILLTTGGTPSIYAGDEFAYRGVKEERFGGDDAVRPEFGSPPSGADVLGRDEFRLHQHLIGLRRRHPWLHTARTSPLKVTNRSYIYETRDGADTLVVALNIDDEPLSVSLPDLGFDQGTILAGSGRRRRTSSHPCRWSRTAGSSSRQLLDRELVLDTVVQPIQNGTEVGVVAGGPGEERHRRTHLEIVGPAEDLGGRRALDPGDHPGAFPQPRAEHGVVEVGLGLRQRPDPVAVRSRAAAERPQLRKDEPDPVAAFAAAAQLVEHRVVDAILRFDEASKIEWIVTIGCRQFVHCPSEASLAR